MGVPSVIPYLSTTLGLDFHMHACLDIDTDPVDTCINLNRGVPLAPTTPAIPVTPHRRSYTQRILSSLPYRPLSVSLPLMLTCDAIEILSRSRSPGTV